MLKNPREVGKLAARSQSKPDFLHKPGDPLDQTTTFGSLSSMKAANKVKAQIELAVANGAKAVEIGPEVPADSAFVRPTLLLDVTADNPIFQQEIFGPVMMIFSWNDEKEALKLANGTSFGLGGSVCLN